MFDDFAIKQALRAMGITDPDVVKMVSAIASQDPTNVQMVKAAPPEVAAPEGSRVLRISADLKGGNAEIFVVLTRKALEHHNFRLKETPGDAPSNANQLAGAPIENPDKQGV